jgi:rsbT co-antagonist protein RsbR
VWLGQRHNQDEFMKRENKLTTLESFSDEIRIDEQEVIRRKEFLEFNEKDEEVLQGLHDAAEGYAGPVIEELYRHFLSFEETKAFFRDPKVLARVKRMQTEYFLRLTKGNYDANYVANRLRIGSVHEQVNLAPKWYLGAYNFYLRSVAKQLSGLFSTQPQRVLPTFLSLMKLVFLDIGVAVDAYIHARERTMRAQQEAIRELSTPVLQIRDRLLLLPIIGVIDTPRARLITENLLQAVRASRAKVVVMDVTGVATIDSRVANHLLQTVEASRLMGAKVIISGLSSDVAQALVVLGIDLSGLQTVGDLQGGMEEAERLLGLRLVELEDSEAPGKA